MTKKKRKHIPLRELPWMKFLPDVWRADAMLNMCDANAHGLLVNLMCIAHRGEPYGHLKNGGIALTQENVADILRWRPALVKKAWKQLSTYGRIKLSPEHGWYIPRMVRDNQEREQSVAYGSLGGNPKLTSPDNGTDNAGDNRGDNPPDNLDKEGDTDKKKKRVKAFTPPTVEEVKKHMKDKGYRYMDALEFVDFYEMKGWVVGKNKMKSWTHAASRWERTSKQEQSTRSGHRPNDTGSGAVQAGDIE